MGSMDVNEGLSGASTRGCVMLGGEWFGEKEDGVCLYRGAARIRVRGGGGKQGA